MDRAAHYECEGLRFESSWAHHLERNIMENLSQIDTGHSYGWGFLHITDCDNPSKSLHVNSISYINSDFPYDFILKLGDEIVDCALLWTPFDFAYTFDCEGYSRTFVLTPDCAYCITHLDVPSVHSVDVDTNFMFRLFFHFYGELSKWEDFWDEPIDAKILQELDKVYDEVKRIYKGETL